MESSDKAYNDNQSLLEEGHHSSPSGFPLENRKLLKQ